MANQTTRAYAKHQYTLNESLLPVYSVCLYACDTAQIFADKLLFFSTKQFMNGYTKALSQN